jgi:hypothetical protein
MPRGWLESADFQGLAGARISGIAFGNGRFIAVGASKAAAKETAATWVSANGLRWIGVGQANFPDAFDAVTFNGTDFYAFGSAPTTLWKSADGNHWTQVDLPQTAGGELGTFNAFTGSSVSEASSVGSKMYAAGDATTVSGDIACTCVSAWQSANGTDWTQSTVAQDDSFQAFAAVPDMALVIANGSYIGQAPRASTDFESWNNPEIDLAEGSGYLGAAAGTNRIVAVGYGGDSKDIPISLVWDGSTWSGSSIGGGTGGPAEQVAWAGGQFVAVGTKVGGDRLVAVSWSSQDGLTWKPAPDVYDLPRPAVPPEAGDDPFQHRTIGGGTPGFVVAQTIADRLHVWFATAETF